MQVLENNPSLILAPKPAPNGKIVISGAIVAALAMCVWVGIMVAGLWPFHAPRNQVEWLTGSNGVRFGRYGTLIGSGPIDRRDIASAKGLSIELWLHPRVVWQDRTILGFDAPQSPLQFSLRQKNPNLELRAKVRHDRGGTRLVRWYVSNILRRRTPFVLTVTSDASETSVYVNGDWVQSRRGFPLSSVVLDGRLIVGNSPIENDSWSGVLQGLGIYREALSPDQVKRHYQSWIRDGRPGVTAGERNVALYLFNEHRGNVVHNQATGGPDLIIPARYLIAHEKFLETPWSEFKANRDDLKSVLMNIAGLVPLGFIFCAFLSCYPRRFKHPLLFAVLLGFATSVSIEVLQSFLPTRDSGMTDIITNTLGTYLGACLYRSRWVRNTISRFPLLPFFLP